MKIIIIDTACANLASLKFCLDRLGFNATISRDLKELESADKLFLPGVGTAKEAMKNLEQFNLIDFIQNTKKPLLGKHSSSSFHNKIFVNFLFYHS